MTSPDDPRSPLSPERQAAEQQITNILNRALKLVPLVRLDCVDEVIRLFTDAIEMMESNLEIEDDDEEGIDEETRATRAQQQHDGQSKLLALAGAGGGGPGGGGGGGTLSTATTASNTSASSSDSEVETMRTATTIANKALANVALTVDYSSPASRTRSLGGQGSGKGEDRTGPNRSSRASGGPLGIIGLKGASGGGTGSVGAPPPKLGLGGHKMSSRATTGLNALNQQQTTPSPNSPSSPDDSETGASGESGTSGGIGGSQGQLIVKNKFVTKIAGSGSSSREFPSPKLGPRTLGGSGSAPGSANRSPIGTPTIGSAAPSNPAAAGLSLPLADQLGREGGQMGVRAPSSGGVTPDADDEGPEDESESGDLIRADKKNSVFNRVKQTLPVTASPKQIRSSFHLLELAKQSAASPEDGGTGGDDLTKREQTTNGSEVSPPSATAASSTTPPSSSSASQGQSTPVLSALPSGLQSSSTSNTPKPPFLRRLDSPDTHHGQLIAAKARLQLLLNRGLQVAEKVKLDKVPEIRISLEKALAKLEQSLVPTATGNIV